MHAVLVHVTINDAESSETELRDTVVPRVSKAPGFVAGYWTRKDNDGRSLTVWESQDAAQAASDMIRTAAPTGVDVQSVEVREVVASA